jgi:long-chain acyl-CoA synthetase
MLLQGFLEASFEREPERTALVSGEDRVTYGALEAEANRFAHAVAGLGLGRGDRVVLFLENCLPAAVGIWGTLKAGGVFVPVSASLKASGLAYVLADCGARVLVTDAGRAPIVEEALRGLADPPVVVWTEGDPGRLGGGVDPVLYSDALAAQSEARPACRSIDQDLAALVYTSGSTGRPKGVMEAHWNVVSVTRTIAGYLGNRADDVLAGILPLNAGYGLSQMLTAALVGASLVLQRWVAFPFPMVETMQREGVTGLAGVPTLFNTLLRLAAFREEGLPRLRYLTNAGAGIPPRRVRELREAFPSARLYCMYGQTECQRITYLEPEDADRRPESVGRGMPNQEHWVLDAEGHPVAPGEVGELVVRGSHVMRGYWGLPEESARCFRPGPVPGELVLHTGDLFRVDAEGYLTFVSRMDDIIKCKGQKVSPKEVEDALYELPDIVEAAVVPGEDEMLGQSVLAHVVLAEGSALTPRRIQQHCAGRLEDYKVPQQVIVRESLPKGETGKIDKLALRG